MIINVLGYIGGLTINSDAQLVGGRRRGRGVSFAVFLKIGPKCSDLGKKSSTIFMWSDSFKYCRSNAFTVILRNLACSEKVVVMRL